MYGEPHATQYAADMVKRLLYGIQDFRTALAARVKAGTDEGEHTVLQMRGRPVGAYVPIEWYRRAAAALDEPTEY
jgi:hypothetical protein